MIKYICNNLIYTSKISYILYYYNTIRQKNREREKKKQHTHGIVKQFASGQKSVSGKYKDN
jgi:hypothetical protein